MKIQIGYIDEGKGCEGKGMQKSMNESLVANNGPSVASPPTAKTWTHIKLEVNGIQETFLKDIFESQSVPIYIIFLKEGTLLRNFQGRSSRVSWNATGGVSAGNGQVKAMTIKKAITITMAMAMARKRQWRWKLAKISFISYS